MSFFIFYHNCINMFFLYPPFYGYFTDYKSMDQDISSLLDIFNPPEDLQRIHAQLLGSIQRPEGQDIFQDLPENRENANENQAKSEKGMKTRKLKKRRVKRKYSSDIELNKGHWSTYENQMYHRFLQIHSNHFLTKELRRLDKIFKLMSTYIPTRKAEQCRSHHQKMEKKHLSFIKIIAELRTQFFKSWDAHYVKQDLQQNGHLKYDALISQSDIQKEVNYEEEISDGDNDQERDIFGKINAGQRANQLFDENYQVHNTFTHLNNE